MADVSVIIFHPATMDGGPLSELLTAARERLAMHHLWLFRAAGAAVVEIERGRGTSFGALLAGHAAHLRGSGLVVLGAGAAARLRRPDAERLVAFAASGRRAALTNNRYSSDVCAVGDGGPLVDLPALPGDNALPRWLAERAGFEIAELRARERLAFDLDSPLDLALLALQREAPAGLADLSREAGLAVPRLDELRARLADPRAEVLVAGRTSSSALRWLERVTACRIRFLAEERGLRAASPLAQWPPTGATDRAVRPPRSILGRLLARRGAGALAWTVAELADGAIIDTRVLLADRLGADEVSWPAAEDRFASDLLRAEAVQDPWLRAITAAAAASSDPILFGGHTLLGPGLRLVAPRPRKGRPGDRRGGPGNGGPR